MSKASNGLLGLNRYHIPPDKPRSLLGIGVMEKENPFKLLSEHPEQVPAGLKDKVMANIGFIKLSMDMTTLFTLTSHQALITSGKRKKKRND
ncbi:hypothetical protein B7P33_17060 [Sediminicola luteus]|uniref:Uncharacterized protein n=1 Tax=Sediminicola luteus TaxID=319238 RepID=A0A2A4G5G6_9FLAO|nr:hypothetical protein B7P33_17060 [Sediminicola luteus]